LSEWSFRQKSWRAFHQVFDENKQQIRNFDGCLQLELHADPANENVRYTFSLWRSQADLDAYRKSELFQQVWPRTKALFAARPQAFSLQKLEEVEEDLRM
jgi:autoinducer 2-degrading protein